MRGSRGVLPRIRGAGLSVLLVALLAPADIAVGAPPTGAPIRTTPPFATAVPWILPVDAWEAGVTSGTVFDERAPFDNAGAGAIDRSRSVLLGDVAFGLDERVEGSISFSGQTSWGDESGNHPAPGDLRLGFGYALDGRGDTAVATTARFSVKVPTAPDRHGAGTDEADLGIDLTSGVRTARSGIFGSAGFALLGNPLENGSQDDIVSYALAGWTGREDVLQATAEIEGQALSRFGNSASYLHLGVRRVHRQPGGRALAGHAAISRGLSRDASLWGITLGLTWAAPSGR